MPPCPKPQPASKKKKKRSKTERQIIEARLDDLVRDIVKLRDKGTCVVCGSTARPQAGHFFVRERMAVRWDLKNVNCQCASCNIRHRFDQQPYTYWFVQKYGWDEYEKMYATAEVLKPSWSVPELYDLEQELMQRLALLSDQMTEVEKTQIHSQIASAWHPKDAEGELPS